MRLVLLPITTRRALIYCEPLPKTVPVAEQSYLDRAVNKANSTWTEWENDRKALLNWKGRITHYGNLMFRRIAFEEWGLKSIPPLRSKATLHNEGSTAQGSGKGVTRPQQERRVEMIYPATYQGLMGEPVMSLLKRLATERQSLHRKRMWWSLVGMPLTAPLGLLPIMPNIPFFYLFFRAYSHWRALSGSQHLEHLVTSNALSARPSSTLDNLYTIGLLRQKHNASQSPPNPSREEMTQLVNGIRARIKSSRIGSNVGSATDVAAGSMSQQALEVQEEEVMLLQSWSAKLIAEGLRIPTLEIEIDRAVEQVEKALEKKRLLKEESKSLNRATSNTLNGSPENKNG